MSGETIMIQQVKGYRAKFHLVFYSIIQIFIEGTMLVCIGRVSWKNREWES